jgi:hypothetical protein
MGKQDKLGSHCGAVIGGAQENVLSLRTNDSDKHLVTSTLHPTLMDLPA